MACAGLKFLDGQLPDHIKSIPQTKRGLNFALEVMRIASEFTYRAGKTFQMKIGIHYGNCIYGLLGYHKPQFSLIGDTINTTSRHCTTGKAGYIILSEAAFQQLDSNIRSSSSFEVKDIYMKGKGTVHTYCLNICGEVNTKNKLTSIGTLLKGRLTGMEQKSGFNYIPADSSVNLPLQLPMLIANYVKDNMTFGKGANQLDISAHSRDSGKLEKADLASETSMEQEDLGRHVQSPMHVDTPKMVGVNKQPLFLNLESPIAITRQLGVPNGKKSDRRIAVNPKGSMIEAVVSDDMIGLFDSPAQSKVLDNVKQQARIESVIPDTPIPGSASLNPSNGENRRPSFHQKKNALDVPGLNVLQDDLSPSQARLLKDEPENPDGAGTFSLAIKRVDNKDGAESLRNGYAKSDGTAKIPEPNNQFIEEMYDEDDDGEENMDNEEDEDEFKEEGGSGMFGFANTPKSFFSNYQSDYSHFDSVEAQFIEPKSGSFSRIGRMQNVSEDTSGPKGDCGQPAFKKSVTVHYPKKDGLDANNPNEFESRNNYQTNQNGTSKPGLFGGLARVLHPFPDSKPNLLPMYYCKMASMYGSTFRLAVILKLLLLFVNFMSEFSQVREYNRNANPLGNLQNYVNFGARLSIGLIYSILLVPGFIERWARSVKFMILFNLYLEFALDLLPCIWV